MKSIHQIAFWASFAIITLLGAVLLSSCGNTSSSDGGSPEKTSDDDDDWVAPPAELSYPVVDTGQYRCYGLQGEADCVAPGDVLFGQDAQYDGLVPDLEDLGDGTVLDHRTGLMWTQSLYGPMTWEEMDGAADNLELAGYGDWRMPTIKELYSLIDFTGESFGEAGTIPYIDDSVFEFFYGDPELGQREIDVQVWSATEYVGTTMNGARTVFGVNFADGRIKGYGITRPGHGGPDAPEGTAPLEGFAPPGDLPPPGEFGGVVERYARYVRGTADYGVNDFADRGDGTVLDRATGLVWQQADDGQTRDWPESLAYCENLELAGQTDWRLPNAKELQSIVDYTRAPTVSGEAAIDPVFGVSDIESYYWTSTTHRDGPPDRFAGQAVYVAFGRAMGYMEFPPGSGNLEFIDVHGAGAQRSDPKVGDPEEFPTGRGPQGDDIRIYNYVRCVR